MVRRELVDLWDVVESQEKDLEEREETIEELRDEMDAFDNPEDIPESILTLHDELVAEYNEREQLVDVTRNRLEEYEEYPVIENPEVGEVSGWSSTQFRLKELSMGDIGRIQDKTGVEINDAQDAFEAGEGAAMVESLRLTVERSPDGAPDDPADLPIPIGQAILLKSNDLAGMDPENDELGKSSARQYLAS